VHEPPGEFELIAAIRERIERAGAPAQPPGLIVGSGDDAAVSTRDGVAVTSVDAVIEGVHFRIPPFEPRSVGHKALAAALSDLAAMGATAREAYVQLGVPDGTGESVLLELADGLGALAAEHGVAVAGGDVTRAPALLLAVTVIGEAPSPEAIVRRAGAAPGDAVAVTGELGGAGAGLLLLERPELAAGLSEAVGAALRVRQLEPVPRLVAGGALAAAGASAMIDLSDGLGGDAAHLASASGVAIRIEAERLPVQPGVPEIAAGAGVAVLELAAGGGEDYELLVALPGDRVEAAKAALAERGVPLTVIGSVEKGEGVELSDRGGSAGPIPGFDQLRPRPARPDRA
jgi:thiamine-monophosphate kinase